MSLPLLRTVQTSGKNLVVICDKELLGKKFKEGKYQIEVKESFYAGSEASVEKCLEALKSATIANMLGSIVKHATEVGLIERGCVLEIQGVQHAQLVRL